MVELSLILDCYFEHLKKKAKELDVMKSVVRAAVGSTWQIYMEISEMRIVSERL